jgi:hypothetical protein
MNTADAAPGEAGRIGQYGIKAERGQFVVSHDERGKTAARTTLAEAVAHIDDRIAQASA